MTGRPARGAAPGRQRAAGPARDVAEVDRPQGDGTTTRHGVHPVMEALGAGVVLEVAVAGAARPQVAAVVRRAEYLRVPVREVLAGDLDRATGGARHQGVAATIRPHPYLTLDELRVLVARATGDPLLVALDGVEDPQNFGAVLRSAEGAGALAVLVPERGMAPASSAVARASAGAVDRVRLVRVPSIANALGALRRDGFKAIGLEGGAAVPYDEVDLVGRMILVAGSEGRGLGRGVRQACDQLVRIPLHGAVASLNVSVAVAVVAFASRAARRRAAGTDDATSGQQGDASGG